MNKTVIGLIIFVALTAGVAVIALGGNSNETATTVTNSQSSGNDTDASTNNTTAQNDSTDTFTAAEVATHNTASDCWTIINGVVYDITDYVTDHPGGDTIVAACGNDGTSLFTQRTTTDGETVGSGTPHSSTATSQLELFKIGELTE